MQVCSLDIRQLRNISAASLEFSPGLNVIAGANGSGKTSLLEALYLLGRGRSFRSRSRDSLIQSGQVEATVVGRLQSDHQSHRIACQLSSRERRLRVDGTDIRRSAELALLLPLQFINQQSLDLVDRGPAPRRKFLDWGVFHVEPGFYPAWQRYQRVLQQRNAALRQHQAISAWDTEFVQAAGALHDYRRGYFEGFNRCFEQTRELLLGMPVTIAYQPGWNDRESLQEALQRQASGDRARHFTQSGPHRADLLLTIAGKPAADRLSRGQQKLLVAAMALAQARLYGQRCQRPCIVLVDDLTAELDTQHITSLLRALLETGAQVFVTVTDAGLVKPVQAASQSLFHVEQGRFRRAEVI